VHSSEDGRASARPPAAPSKRRRCTGRATSRCAPGDASALDSTIAFLGSIWKGARRSSCPRLIGAPGTPDGPSPRRRGHARRPPGTTRRFMRLRSRPAPKHRPGIQVVGRGTGGKVLEQPAVPGAARDRQNCARSTSPASVGEESADGKFHKIAVREAPRRRGQSRMGHCAVDDR
jgi:hypothetical protein